VLAFILLAAAAWIGTARDVNLLHLHFLARSFPGAWILPLATALVLGMSRSKKARVAATAVALVASLPLLVSLRAFQNRYAPDPFLPVERLITRPKAVTARPLADLILGEGESPQGLAVSPGLQFCAVDVSERRATENWETGTWESGWRVF